MTVYLMGYASAARQEMSLKKRKKKTGHGGSSFDSFLEEEGIREEVEAIAIKRMQSLPILAAGNPFSASQTIDGKVKRRGGQS